MYHRCPHPTQDLENPTVLYKKNDYFVMGRGTKEAIHLLFAVLFA